MKKFKKATAFFLAAVMILAMNCTAFAAQPPENPEETTQKSDVVENHKFTAYQIFKGTISDKSLVAIQWGDNIDGKAFLEALQAENTFGGSAPFAGIVYDENYPNRSADAVARVISGDAWKGDKAFEANELAREFARIAHAQKKGTGVGENGTLHAGYYLVVDEEVLPNGTVNSVRNLSFLEMVSDGAFHPTVKVDVPELEKKVKEINDSDVTVVDKWGDVADYDIGDAVEFTLTGTLPTDYDSYETYRYVFHDALSKGLIFTDNIKVEIVNQGSDPVRLYGNGFGGPREEFTVGNSTDKDSFTVVIEDLKKLNGQRGIVINAETKIVVTYTATLDGGLNGANVIIGGAGNENKAWLEYSNDPNFRGDGTPPTGTTPEDKVVVFTYQLIPSKVDENGDALAGAGFSLYKLNGKTNAYEAYPIKGVTAEKTDDEGNTYYEITGVTEFTFKGVDAGKYKLVETTVPAGYNKAEDMYFDIVAELDETTQSVKKLEIAKVYDEAGKEIVGSDGKTPIYTFGKSTETGNGNLSDGSLKTNIVNLKGILLPSTGGIGTTIFYVIGAILVVGAGVLLVIKKRMSKAE